LYIAQCSTNDISAHNLLQTALCWYFEDFLVLTGSFLKPKFHDFDLLCIDDFEQQIFLRFLTFCNYSEGFTVV